MVDCRRVGPMRACWVNAGVLGALGLTYPMARRLCLGFAPGAHKPTGRFFCLQGRGGITAPVESVGISVCTSCPVATPALSANDCTPLSPRLCAPPVLTARLRRKEWRLDDDKDNRSK